MSTCITCNGTKKIFVSMPTVGGGYETDCPVCSPSFTKVFTNELRKSVINSPEVYNDEYEGTQDDARATMFFASIKNTLGKYVENKVATFRAFSANEIKQIMFDKSPVEIYNTLYSTKQPWMHITKRILPSHEGVYGYFNSAADKTPKYFTWAQFYWHLLIGGLENIRF